MWGRRTTQEIIFASPPIAGKTTITDRGRGGRGGRGVSISALTITTEPTFTRPNPPVELFPLSSGILNAGGVNGGERPYDVAHDGQHFIVIRNTAAPAAVGAGPGSPENASEPLRFHVVVNWFEEIKARIPPP